MAESISLPITNVQKRISAFVIDDLMIALFFLIIFYDQLLVIASHTSGMMSAEEITLIQAELRQFSVDNLLVMLSIKILYHTVPVWQNGTTLGKYIMKIRVIDLKTGTRPSLVQAFLRALLRIGSEIFFYLGFIMAFMMPLRQTFHDKLSNCVVVDA
ncbi:MAG: RDD family protein [Sulfurovum sp.]|nr:MAG: RDD family protein [Sulfurovum sp.]